MERTKSGSWKRWSEEDSRCAMADSTNWSGERRREAGEVEGRRGVGEGFGYGSAGGSVRLRRWFLLLRFTRRGMAHVMVPKMDTTIAMIIDGT